MVNNSFSKLHKLLKYTAIQLQLIVFRFSIILKLLFCVEMAKILNGPKLWFSQPIIVWLCFYVFIITDFVMCSSILLCVLRRDLELRVTANSKKYILFSFDIGYTIIYPKKLCSKKLPRESGSRDLFHSKQ